MKCIRAFSLSILFCNLLASIAIAEESAVNLLKQMIIIASDKGGIGRSDELNAIKKRIEALPKTAHGDKRSARSANEQGLVAFKAGQYAQAKQYFLSAYQTDPSDVEIASNLGLAYLRLGESKEALQPLTAALTRLPGRAATWATLAEYYALQDRQAEAIACYALTFHVSPNKEKTREALQKLASNEDASRGTKIRQAAQQALQLSLIQGSRNTIVSPAVEESLVAPLSSTNTELNPQPIASTGSSYTSSPVEIPNAPKIQQAEPLAGLVQSEPSNTSAALAGQENMLPTEIAILITKWEKLDSDCRTISTNDQHSINACNEREIVRKHIEEKGWCLADKQLGNGFKWKVCLSEDNHGKNRIPLLNIRNEEIAASAPTSAVSEKVSPIGLKKPKDVEGSPATSSSETSGYKGLRWGMSVNEVAKHVTDLYLNEKPMQDNEGYKRAINKAFFAEHSEKYKGSIPSPSNKLSASISAYKSMGSNTMYYFSDGKFAGVEMYFGSAEGDADALSQLQRKYGKKPITLAVVRSVVDEISAWTSDPGRIIVWHRFQGSLSETVYYITRTDYDKVAAIVLKETEQQRNRNQSKLD